MNKLIAPTPNPYFLVKIIPIFLNISLTNESGIIYDVMNWLTFGITQKPLYITSLILVR